MQYSNCLRTLMLNFWFALLVLLHHGSRSQGSVSSFVDLPISIAQSSALRTFQYLQSLVPNRTPISYKVLEHEQNEFHSLSVADALEDLSRGRQEISSQKAVLRKFSTLVHLSIDVRNFDKTRGLISNSTMDWRAWKRTAQSLIASSTEVVTDLRLAEAFVESVISLLSEGEIWPLQNTFSAYVAKLALVQANSRNPQSWNELLAALEQVQETLNHIPVVYALNNTESAHIGMLSRETEALLVRAYRANNNPNTKTLTTLAPSLHQLQRELLSLQQIALKPKAADSVNADAICRSGFAPRRLQEDLPDTNTSNDKTTVTFKQRLMAIAANNEQAFMHLPSEDTDISGMGLLGAKPLLASRQKSVENLSGWISGQQRSEDAGIPSVTIFDSLIVEADMIGETIENLITTELAMVRILSFVRDVGARICTQQLKTVRSLGNVAKTALQFIPWGARQKRNDPLQQLLVSTVTANNLNRVITYIASAISKSQGIQRLWSVALQQLQEATIFNPLIAHGKVENSLDMIALLESSLPSNDVTDDVVALEDFILSLIRKHSDLRKNNA